MVAGMAEQDHFPEAAARFVIAQAGMPRRSGDFA
jgi:hypothetical protein